MAREAPERIRDLLSFGVPFDKDLEGRLTVGREAAHSARRIVHVRGDQAGRAIMAALVAAVRKTPSIRVLEGYVAEDLITDGRARHRRLGAPIAPAGCSRPFRRAPSCWPRAALGHLFAVTTNPSEARGQGLAIAARAGAVIADPEFVQFHPTAIDIGRDPAPLATEAIRGEGATLVNRAGERFMLQDPSRGGARAARHRGARRVRRAAGRARRVPRRPHGDRRIFAERFPGVARILPQRRHRSGARPDPGRAGRALPHGRRATDANGRTSLDGLWAAGEVASTGAHGANRLASNSLLEAVVYAARIAEDIGGPALPRRGRALGPDAARRASRSSIDAGARTGAARADVGACRRRAQRRRTEARARARSPAWSATRARCRSCATWRPRRC